MEITEWILDDEACEIVRERERERMLEDCRRDQEQASEDKYSII